MPHPISATADWRSHWKAIPGGVLAPGRSGFSVYYCSRVDDISEINATLWIAELPADLRRFSGRAHLCETTTLPEA